MLLSAFILEIENPIIAPIGIPIKAKINKTIPPETSPLIAINPSPYPVKQPIIPPITKPSACNEYFLFLTACPVSFLLGIMSQRIKYIKIGKVITIEVITKIVLNIQFGRSYFLEIEEQTPPIILFSVLVNVLISVINNSELVFFLMFYNVVVYD